MTQKCRIQDCQSMANIIVHYKKIKGCSKEDPTPLCSVHYESEDPDIGKYYQIEMERVEILN